MNYEAAKDEQQRLMDVCDVFGDKLKTFPSGPMGLTPDVVKATQEWKDAHYGYHKAFKNLQDFNKVFTKLFKKELAEERAKRFK